MNDIAVVEGQLQIRVNISSLPVTIHEAANEYFTIQQAIKKLESRKDMLFKHTNNMFPTSNEPGETVLDGIRQLRFKVPTTKWKEACSSIIEELVPKTRHDDADIIVNGATSSRLQCKLSPENDISSDL